MRKNGQRLDESCPSILKTEDGDESKEGAAPPSQKFTNTIMQYKEQIQNMRTYLKELENKENEPQ